MKKLILALIFFCFFNVTYVSASDVNLYVNNKKLSFTDQGPTIVDNRVLVPIRGIFESVGAQVSWDQISKTVYIRYEAQEIKMFIGSKRYSVTDGNTGVTVFYDFDVTAQIINNRTLIPLRAVTDGLGGETNWDAKTRSAYINFDGGVLDSFKSDELTFNIGQKKLQMLQTPSEVRNILGIPKREAKNQSGDIFYTYSADYENYIFLGFKDNRLSYVISNSVNFSVSNFKVGLNPFTAKTLTLQTNALYFYEDEANKIAAIAISSNGFIPRNLELEEVEMQIFDFTNAFRAARGLKAFSYSTDLSNVGRAHSEDMAENDYFSHTSQDGRSFDQRIKNGGINFTAAAENIGYGTNDPFKLVHMWLLSDGHRKNMMRDIDELGVGGTLKGYYTQCFATRR